MTVCDPYGACDSCQSVIVVEDRTPPTIVCPAPITVEFQDENGAVVPCAVTASDNCPGVSLWVTPPCGSLFPIGTTPVQATATDAATNTASCTFTVTVLGAQGVKSNVLVELIVLRDQATIQQSGSDTEWWNCAIQNMILLAANQPVAGPEARGVRQTGGEVFDQEKNVVVCLTNLIDWGGSGIPGPTLQNLVDRLVRADRLLAVVSIQEAVLAGVSPVIISNALVYVARGDEAAMGGQAAVRIRQCDHVVQEGVGVDVPGVSAGGDDADWGQGADPVLRGARAEVSGAGLDGHGHLGDAESDDSDRHGDQRLRDVSG